MTPRRRLGLLAVALAATLGAVAWVGGEEEAVDDVVAPVARNAASVPRARAPEKEPAALDLAALDARGMVDMKADLFAPKSWYVPPPPPPPPKPVAPALPFTFLGRLVEADGAAVFVASGERNQVIRAGDVIDNTWRVEAIEPARVRFLYLPLNEEKYLALGAVP